MANKAAAINWFHCTPYCDIKLYNPYGNVRISSDLVKVKANRNSSHDKINEKIAVEIIPGTANGRMTFVKACHLVAPSINATSSKSCGIPLKKAVMIHVQ